MSEASAGGTTSKINLLSGLSVGLAVVAAGELALLFTPYWVAEDLWIAALSILSARLLWLKRKISWLIAMIGLFAAQGMNCALLFESGSMVWLDAFRLFSALWSFAAVIGVLYYARYPYFDRRQGWLKMNSERLNVRLPVVVHEDDGWPGTCVSLSETGCRIELSRPWGHPERLEMVRLEFPSFGPSRLRGYVVGAEGHSLRVKFRDVGPDRIAFESWVRSFSPPPEEPAENVR